MTMQEIKKAAHSLAVGLWNEGVTVELAKQILENMIMEQNGGTWNPNKHTIEEVESRSIQIMAYREIAEIKDYGKPQKEEKVISLDRVTTPATNGSVPDYSTMTDKELKAFFKAKIATDSRWTRNALLAIYKYQTEHEKTVAETVDHNGVGFSGTDSNILTSFAKGIQERNMIFSPKQLAVAQKLMPKYAGQLVRIVRNQQ